MFKAVCKPNLPINKAAHCLIGDKNINEINELTTLGVLCIPLKSNQKLDSEISSHADILAFYGDNKNLFISEGSVGDWDLKAFDFFETSVKGIHSPYPDDIRLNAALIGNKIFCRIRNIANEIYEFCIKNKIEIINTNQGYARCNICIIKENAVITEDKGLACLLKNYQFDVLEISSGSVYLSERHHGFLGGASAKLSDDTIYFSGDLEAHRDYIQIIKFLNKYNVKPIYNSNRKLNDFGGIIQLTEYI